MMARSRCNGVRTDGIGPDAATAVVAATKRLSVSFVVNLWTPTLKVSSFTPRTPFNDHRQVVLGLTPSLRAA